MTDRILSLGYRWLGRLGYDEAHAEQRRLVDDRVHGIGEDTFLALEHEPVLTLGKNATLAHLHLSEAEYAARGIALRRVERGGEVT
ncbi:MAG: lipoyl protein ligase domain-containing protein, partial [Candidatus Limnocylindrus sp.]